MWDVRWEQSKKKRKKNQKRKKRNRHWKHVMWHDMPIPIIFTQWHEAIGTTHRHTDTQTGLAQLWRTDNANTYKYNNIVDKQAAIWKIVTDTRRVFSVDVMAKSNLLLLFHCNIHRAIFTVLKWIDKRTDKQKWSSITFGQVTSSRPPTVDSRVTNQISPQYIFFCSLFLSSHFILCVFSIFFLWVCDT